MKKRCLVALILILFIISSIPVSFGNDVNTNEKPSGSNDFNKYLYPEYYDRYNVSEIAGYDTIPSYEYNNFLEIGSKKTNAVEETSDPLNSPPMDSPWPMYCHDIRHTGQSPYSTIDTWDKVWNFETLGWADGGPTIDENGTIYIGSYYLYAVYPNGTLKWTYHSDSIVGCAPAIDENGTIYFGTIYGDGSLYAINSNGTKKWRYYAGGNIFSSPTVGDDGVIYFGSGGGYPPSGYINAVYPNGTLKWKYNTDHVVYSSPALGPDDMIYCGSHDKYLYALYPNNGTLKWKYKTGDWIRTSSCIADGGTIYVVSLDGYLYAINPNGNLKWKTDVGAGTSPTIGQDGTIYAGYSKLYAINPSNGSVKWTFPVGGTIRGGTPCNSVDGTIYVGTSDGGELIAINPDGTLKWHKKVGAIESPPAIGADGSIYVGSEGEPGVGFLNAFGIGPLESNANGPYYGLINETLQFTGSSSGGYSPHSYHWDFGDTHTSEEQNPTHIFTNAGNYTVTLTVTDNTSNTSTDNTWAWIQNTNTPPDKPTILGPDKGIPETTYTYTFVTTDIDGTDVSYYIDWGDDSDTGWKGLYDSGEQINFSHTWGYKGTYTIKCKAKDPYNAESEWGILEITIPRNRVSYSSLFLRFLEQFPDVFTIFKYIIGEGI